MLRYRGDGETGLWLKMRSAGETLWYCPEATAYHIVPGSRMTVEYLKSRAYNQGISQSFTEFRTRHGLYGMTCRGPRAWIRAAKDWAKRRQFVQWLWYRYRRVRTSDGPERTAARARYETARSFAHGWAFHRSALRSDRSLREFVVRSTFLK